MAGKLDKKDALIVTFDMVNFLPLQKSLRRSHARNG
jgi:hypothetical protein